MSRPLRIVGAEVITTSGIERLDLDVGPETISVAEGALPDDARSIDGGGLVLGPGFVDMHVHFREPGQEWKEDVSSGSAAAIAGGFTAVVTMPNTEPAIDSRPMAEEAMQRAREEDRLDVAVAGSITVGRSGEALADLEGMYGLGVRMFTDDGDSVPDPALLRKAMNVVKDLPGALIAQHAEDTRLTKDGQMHLGLVSRELGLSGLPSEAEIEVVQRDIEIARETGAPLHVQHVSAAGTLELIAAAKGEGLAVTAEVTPHHLILTDEDLRGRDPNLKMYPPLRAAADREALVEALRSGVIDAVATDHAPHSDAEKATRFEDAPRGVIGLETAFAMTLHALDGDIRTTFDRLSTAPAGIMDLSSHGVCRPGSSSNLVLVDPTAPVRFESFSSRSSNSPFLGREARGKVVMTIHNGRVVYEGARGG